MIDWLAGKRILVVEDSHLLGSALADYLADAGARVVGPCASVDDALAAWAGAGTIDLAILDVKLAGETSEPIAVRAEEMGAAVLLMTGFDLDSLPPALRHFPRCLKPFNTRTLTQALRGIQGIPSDGMHPCT